jgi:hypothetical protein
VKIRARGRTKRKGIQNSTESKYELILRALKQQGKIHCYRYEAITLRLADRTTYTPDFAVLLPDGLMEFHEVKGGRVFAAGAVKYKIAAEQYPEFQFVWCQEKRGVWTVTRK